MATEPTVPTFDAEALTAELSPIIKDVASRIAKRTVEAAVEQLTTGTDLAERIQAAEDEAKRFSIAWAEERNRASNAISNGTILEAAKDVTAARGLKWEEMPDGDKEDWLADVTVILVPVATALGLLGPVTPTLAEVTFEDPGA